jgi:hypothetical protein
MENKLANVQEAMYLLVAPHELLTVKSGNGPSCIFNTDGSLIEGCAGFAVHQIGVGRFEYKIQGSAGVFTAELSALFIAQGLIKAMLYRKVAHQTHLLVYECKQLC